MIRKYVRPRQPDFVMPPCPTHPNPVAQIFALLASLSAFLHAPNRPCHDGIRHVPNPLHPTPIRHMCQLRPSYGHSTHSTPLRYKSLLSSYKECRNVECSHLCADTNPPNIPLLQPRRNPPSQSHRRKPPPCDSFVSYGPGIACDECDASQIRKKSLQLPRPSHLLFGAQLPPTRIHAPYTPTNATKHGLASNASRHAALPARLSRVSRRTVGG